jgi:hypothetical protein
MILYSVVLFLHIVSAFGISAALALEALTLFRLRQAATYVDARRSIDLMPGLPAIMISSGVLLLISGGYLTTQMSGWSLPWIISALAGLILIAPLGAVSGRRMRAIRRACVDGGPAKPGFSALLRDPLLSVSLNIRIALTLGIALLMTAKPELRESISIIGVSVILGILSALSSARRHTSASLVGSIQETKN